MSARGLLEEELRPAVLARCDGLGVVAGEVDGDDVTADVGDLCAALAARDGRATVASQGAAVLNGHLTSVFQFIKIGFYKVLKEAPGILNSQHILDKEERQCVLWLFSQCSWRPLLLDLLIPSTFLRII